MAPKRKMEINDALDENERICYALFQNVANNISHLYSKSLNHQKLAFQAGQKYAYVKLHEWMLAKLQEGRMVTVHEILIYLQGELNDNTSDVGPGGEGASGSRQNGELSDVAASSSWAQAEVAASSSGAQAGQNQHMQMDY